MAVFKHGTLTRSGAEQSGTYANIQITQVTFEFDQGQSSVHGVGSKP